MEIFSNASFNQSFKFEGYPYDPIHLDMNTNVYVEVKGRKGNFFFLIELKHSHFCLFILWKKRKEMSLRIKIS